MANYQMQNSLLMVRLVALGTTELAIQLAQQAGEVVTRPLTEAQLQRALDVLSEEAEMVGGLLRRYYDHKPE